MPLPRGYLNPAQQGVTLSQHLTQTLVARLLVSEVNKFGEIYFGSAKVDLYIFEFLTPFLKLQN